MTNLALHRESSQAIVLPAPRMGPINIRPASLQGADMMFVDRLQKMHSKAVGFRPRDQIEARIKAGHVLIAQDPQTTERIGYIMFADKYFKREDLGIVYQLNITPHKQRGLVGAALVKAAFEACPWGVKLFCCWCAQDLPACHFWESLGFVPIAFRAGGRGGRGKEHGGKRKEGRMQIFWQRRINQERGIKASRHQGIEGEASGINSSMPGCLDASMPSSLTPYWYPTETSGGAMKENRIVLPIPPGKHWSDELPFVLPGMEGLNDDPRALARGGGEGDGGPLPHGRGSSGTRTRKRKSAPPTTAGPKRGLWFAAATATPTPEVETAQSKPKSKRQTKRNDPKLVAAAREWRDRYLEQVNAGLILPPATGKYDVSRQLEAASPALKQTLLLKAA